MRITIVGTGYVGLVTGTCFAEMGNEVYCVDIDTKKIENLKKCILPIYEPGLKSMVEHNIKEQRLHFSTSLNDVINDTDCVFIAVGTPQDDDGSSNLSFVYSVARDIGESINKDIVVVDKSTVPVGTGDSVKNIISKKLLERNVDYNIHIVSNPEFLKEGDAIRDFMHPDRIVIGYESEYAKEKITQLYSSFNMKNDRIIYMSVKEAELTKYAANAMLATKISFINEIATLCDLIGIDVDNIRKGIGSDSRIGYSFIYPGCGYGGSCFPKDVKSMIHTAKEFGLDPMILNSVEMRNQKQKKYLFSLITKEFGADLSGLKFGVWGLAFKPGTDDMREAPSIDIIDSITGSGGAVKVFDPVANDNAKEIFNDDAISYHDDMYDAIDDVDALILVTEWKQFRNPDFNLICTKLKQKYIFDGRNQYLPDKMKSLNIVYKGIGR